MRPQPLQPLRRTRGIIGLGRNNDPIHRSNIIGFSCNRRIDAHWPIRRLNRKGRHWTPHTQRQLVTARLLQQRRNDAADRSNSNNRYPSHSMSSLAILDQKRYPGLSSQR